MIRLISFQETDKLEAGQILVYTYSKPPWNENWTLDRALTRIGYFTSSIASMAYRLSKNDTTIGYIFGRKDIIADKDIFYLDEFFIHPDHQARGYGKQALKILEDQLKDIGIEIIELHTIKEDVGFYKKVGYDKSDLIHFEKTINL